jgi:hypothetical protein
VVPFSGHKTVTCDEARDALSHGALLFSEDSSPRRPLHDAPLSTERCSPRRPFHDALLSTETSSRSRSLRGALPSTENSFSEALSPQRFLGLPHPLFTGPLGRSEEVSGSSICYAPCVRNQYPSILKIDCGLSLTLVPS